MPQGHNHHDRGALHADCPACTLVATMMSEAGVDPAQVRDYRRQIHTEVTAPRIGNTDSFWRQMARTFRTPVHADTMSFEWSADDRPDLEGDEAELVYLNELLLRARMTDMPYGFATQASHAYLEHEHFMIPLGLTLVQAQEIHAGLHHMGMGHGDAPDHFVERFDTEALKARQRLLAQRFESKGTRALKAERHRQRERAARASREAVFVESARSLKRAIDHAKGTVLARAQMDTGGNTSVDIQVGVKDRVTIAAASIGNTSAVGTAICHPTDRFDATIGRQLAIARALVALGSYHELEWMTQVSKANA